MKPSGIRVRVRIERADGTIVAVPMAQLLTGGREGEAGGRFDFGATAFEAVVEAAALAEPETLEAAHRAGMRVVLGTLTGRVDALVRDGGLFRLSCTRGGV
jgi:hypothetical protein